MSSNKSYETLAPVYLSGCSLSIVAGVIALRKTIAEGKTVDKSSPSLLFLAVTWASVCYSMKFGLSAVAWYASGEPEQDYRKSFHIIDDNCETSVLYEAFMGLLCVSLNVVRSGCPCAPVLRASH